MSFATACSHTIAGQSVVSGNALMRAADRVKLGSLKAAVISLAMLILLSAVQAGGTWADTNMGRHAAAAVKMEKNFMVALL